MDTVKRAPRAFENIPYHRSWPVIIGFLHSMNLGRENCNELKQHAPKMPQFFHKGTWKRKEHHNLSHKDPNPKKDMV